MFTGIIEEVGAITRRSGADFAVMATKVLEDLHLGDSIAIDGACMTVAALLEDGFVVQVSPESLERTTLKNLRVGHAVNLERAMRVGQRIGGHFVQGHVDGIGRIVDVTPQGDFSLWRFQAPAEVAKYLVPKGSVAVDGISLTVVDPVGDSFGVAVIPTTLRETTLGAKRAGDSVNMEADMFGKHIYHYVKGGSQGGVTMDALRRYGFA